MIRKKYKKNQLGLISQLSQLLTPVLFCTVLQGANVTLCYHGFNYSDSNNFALMPEVFEAHIRFLKRNNVKIIHVGELIDAYFEGKDTGDSALITIDDGDREVKDIISIVEKENVPITLCLYPGVLDRKKAYLSTEDVAKLKDMPLIDFISHSYTHIKLKTADDKELYREIVLSKKKLEAMTGRQVDALAYPFGLFNAKVKDMVSQNYKIAFSVYEGSNTAETDKYSLKRSIVYRSTSFRDFENIIETGLGKNNGIAGNSRKIGEKGLAKLYTFPAQKKKEAVLVLPGSDIGAGWLGKQISALNKADIQVFAVLNRNNNILPRNVYQYTVDIQNWGLSIYMKDIKDALNSVSENYKNIVVITCGDSFDILTAVLSSDLNYQFRVKGIIAINPSTFQSKYDEYTVLMNKGGYSTAKFMLNQRTRELADLMVLNPEGVSPFGKEMGFENIKNKDLFLNTVGSSKNVEFGLDINKGEYTLDDLKDAYTSSLTVFPAVVPMKLKKDLNKLWCNDFYLKDFDIVHAKEISCPVVYYYSLAYQDNVERIIKMFSGMVTRNRYLRQNDSTVEIMLSDSVSKTLLKETEVMLE